MPDSSFDSPDCSGCLLRAEVLFLLPVLLEAPERVDALVRLREGEDARVAMKPTYPAHSQSPGFHAGSDPG